MKTAIDHKPRWSRFDVVMTVAAVTLVSLFLGAGAFFYLEKSSQHAAQIEAERTIANLNTRGAPVDAKSSKATYDSRTYPEDAEAWMKIFNQMNSQGFRDQTKDIFPFNPNKRLETQAELENQLALQRKLVHDNANLLNTIHELASHRKPVRFDIEFDVSSSRDYITGFLHLIRLQVCEFQVRLADGDSSLIQQSLISQFDAISVSQGEFLTIDQLITSAMKRELLLNVKKVVESNLMRQQDLEQILVNLQALPIEIQHWRENVQYERAFLLAYFRQAIPDQTQVILKEADKDLGLATHKDLMHFLYFMDRYENVDWSTWKTAKDSLEEIEADLRNASSSASMLEKHNWQNTSILTRSTPILGATSWSSYAQDLAQSQSEQNQALVACALRLYQMKHGSFPDRLEQLVDVGIDPKLYLSMADLPFGYECQDKTAYLWGPIRDNDGEFPFEIAPHHPTPSKGSKGSERIDQALWALEP